MSNINLNNLTPLAGESGTISVSGSLHVKNDITYGGNATFGDSSSDTATFTGNITGSNISGSGTGSFNHIRAFRGAHVGGGTVGQIGDYIVDVRGVGGTDGGNVFVWGDVSTLGNTTHTGQLNVTTGITSSNSNRIGGTQHHNSLGRGGKIAISGSGTSTASFARVNIKDGADNYGYLHLGSGYSTTNGGLGNTYIKGGNGFFNIYGTGLNTGHATRSLSIVTNHTNLSGQFMVNPDRHDHDFIVKGVQPFNINLIHTSGSANKVALRGTVDDTINAPIQLQNDVYVAGDITASNISSSGTITANEFVGSSTSTITTTTIISTTASFTDISSSMIPDADDTYDIGSSTKEWKDLYVDGTAYIDNISGETAVFSGNVTARSNISMSGDLSGSGIFYDQSTSHLKVVGSGSFDTIGNHHPIHGVGTDFTINAEDDIVLSPVDNIDFRPGSNGRGTWFSEGGLRVYNNSSIPIGDGIYPYYGIYAGGSSNHGDSLTNIHQFTGSVFITGSLKVTGSNSSITINQGVFGTGTTTIDDDVETTGHLSSSGNLYVEQSASIGFKGNEFGGQYYGGKATLHVASPGFSGAAISASGDIQSSGIIKAQALEISSNAQDLGDGDAVSLTQMMTFFNTGGAETGTLAAGTLGQMKVLMMRADGGDMVITVTNAGWKSSGTGTITFDTIGDSCTLMYGGDSSGRKWFVIGNNGCTFA